MDGYINNKTRVLNEWYNLFQQKHNHILSDSDHKHWKHVITCAFPNFKKDYWKYTVFEEFLKYHFISHKNIKLNTIFKLNKLKLSIDSYMVVFINGKFSSELSDVLIEPWILKFDKNPSRYNVSDPICPNMFSYLTECLSHYTIHITLPKKTTIEKPLYLLYITEGSNISNQLITSHYCHKLEIEQDTKSCIIEHFISSNTGGYFNGTRTLISVGERSKLNYTKLIFENKKSYHISYQDIYSKKTANINSNTFIIGPKFTHQQTNSQINHEQVSLSLNSLMLLSQKNVGDIHTYLEHNNNDYAMSKQLHKIIAHDYSTGMFTGLIKVNKNAIKTDAKMTNNNLLLNQHASIYSIPKLEIYSDAVQCTHGSTIGQINNDHLFYLNTRGISKKNAITILINSFISEITKKIKNSLLKESIIKKINQDLIRRI